MLLNLTYYPFKRPLSLPFFSQRGPGNDILFLLRLDDSCIRALSTWLVCQRDLSLSQNVSLKGGAENSSGQRTHVCQPRHAETPGMNMPGLILNPTAGGTLAASPRPESTHSAAAQCRCVIHSNAVKLKAVYCSQRPFILLNVRPPLANLSVRASTCQGEEEEEEEG